MRNLLTVIASLGLVGCVGGIDSPSGGDVDDPNPSGPGGGGTGPAAAEAKGLFTDNVQPIIAGKCVGCHNKTGPVGNITGFVDTDKTTAYATATGYQVFVGDFTPAGAGIMTKIKVNPTPSHQTLTYSTDEDTKITAWLAKEVEARTGGGGGTTPPPGGETPQAASQRLLGEWSACMTLANFDAANMKAFGGVNAGGGGTCAACHSLGAYGFIASQSSQPYFDVVSQHKNYLLMYFAVDLTGGVAAAKIIINDRSFAGVATRQAPHYDHPTFNPTNNAGYTALKAFYTSTAAAQAAGGCGAPKLID
jgi:cytochrome c553